MNFEFEEVYNISIRIIPNDIDHQYKFHFTLHYNEKFKLVIISWNLLDIESNTKFISSLLEKKYLLSGNKLLENISKEQLLIKKREFLDEDFYEKERYITLFMINNYCW